MDTRFSAQRTPDGIIARALILILLLILAFLLVDRFGWPLTPTVEAPVLPADYLDYTETIDAYQVVPAVLDARRAYMVEQRLGCETLHRETVAPGVELVTCGSGQ